MLAGAASLALVLPSISAAQAPSQAAVLSHNGPNGLKVGEGRLHPFIDLEPRLDTVAGYFPTTGSGPPTAPSPELIMHLRPGLKFELPSNTVALDVAATAEYLYYTGLLTVGSSIASRLEGAAGLNAVINRQGQIEFDLADDFNYSDKTRNPALGLGALSLYNEARAQLGIRPGGGALEITTRGAFGLEQFRPLSPLRVPGCPANDPTCDPNALAQMNYTNLRAGLDGRWKFLPKTAIVLESNFDYRSYIDLRTNHPSLLLRVMGGLQGLLTTKVAIVVKGGWGYDFASPPAANPFPTANTFLAHAEIAYLLNEASNFRVGYYRSVEPVPVYQTVEDNRVYGEGRMLLSGRLALLAYGALDFLGFGAGSNRLDTAAIVNPSAEYQILPWLYAAAGYTFTMRLPGTGATALTEKYNRHEAYLRVTAAY
jgi:hypothetical protein